MDLIMPKEEKIQPPVTAKPTYSYVYGKNPKVEKIRPEDLVSKNRKSFQTNGGS